MTLADQKKRPRLLAGTIKLRWHAQNQQWSRAIGYQWNRLGKKLVPKVFYFGSDDASALMECAAKIGEWRAVKQDWSRIIPVVEHLYEGKDVSRPFWIQATASACPEQEAAFKTVPILQTIATAKELFLEAKRGSVGIRGRRGLKQSSLNTLERALDAALAQFDLAMPLEQLTYPRLDDAVRKLYTKEELSERCAFNYAKVLQQFLRWCDLQPNLGFSLPKGFNAIFHLSMPQPAIFVPSSEQVKRLLEAATDETKCFILLGINAGMYGADIAALTWAEIVQKDGESWLWWSRTKTSHQNDFKSLHWLFPDTIRLLEKVAAAKNNPLGRVFLNRMGRPLNEDLDGWKRKGIFERFDVARKNADLTASSISFKSLRKFGSTALQNAAGKEGDTLARMYLGQRVPGVLGRYVQDDFAKLTAALRDLYRQLKDQAVL